MAASDELMLEILKRLQGDLTRANCVLDEHTRRFDHIDEQLEAMAGYVTFAMGKSAENRVDVENLLAEVKTIKARLDALEARTQELP
jgi:tetrahydromethanopterin S-methyltransferase subunit G